MTFSFNSVEHALASAAQKFVSEAKLIADKVLPLLKKAAASEATVEAITGLIDPAAVTIERAAYAILGKVLGAIADGQAAVAAGGINITLDQAEIADLKAISVAVKTAVAAKSAA